MSDGRGKSFDWTPFGLPRHIQPARNSFAFSYDAFGSRIVKEESDPRAVLNRTITVGGLFELNVGASIEATYNVMGRDGLVAQVTQSVDAAGQVQPTSSRYVHRDHLGNPDAVTSEVLSGSIAVLERARFDPFGERRSPWAVAHPLAQAYPANASYGFTGHEPDEELRLTNMRGRIYDPVLSRFLSADPFVGRESQALNRYSYVRNSPVMLTDPSGFCPSGAPDCWYWENGVPVTYEAETVIVTLAGLEETPRVRAFDDAMILQSGDRGSEVTTNVQGQWSIYSSAWDYNPRVAKFARHMARDIDRSYRATLAGYATNLPGGNTLIAYRSGEPLGTAIAFDVISVVPVGWLFRAAKASVGRLVESLVPQVGEYAAAGINGFGREVAPAVAAMSSGAAREGLGGTATIIEHAGKHASIVVRCGDDVVHTEQVTLEDGYTTIANVSDAAPTVTTKDIFLPEASRAIEF